MEDLFAKLGTLVVVTLMLIFDWPRALAGVVLGLIARNAGRAWIIIPIGVIASLPVVNSCIR